MSRIYTIITFLLCVCAFNTQLWANNGLTNPVAEKSLLIEDARPAKALVPNQEVKLGKEVSMFITQLDRADGIKASGKGYIVLPYFNKLVQVAFDSIQVNRKGKLLNGRIYAQGNENMAELGFQTYSDLVQPQLAKQFLRVAKNENNFPFSIQKELQVNGLNTPDFDLMISNVFFEKNKTLVDLVVLYQTPEGAYFPFALEQVELGKKGVDFCEVIVPLTESNSTGDIEVPLVIKKYNKDDNDKETGSYIKFNCAGFQELNLSLAYNFSKDKVLPVDVNDEDGVQANFDVKIVGGQGNSDSQSGTNSTQSTQNSGNQSGNNGAAVSRLKGKWNKAKFNFQATASIEEFHVTGRPNVTFTITEATIDYDANENPENFPTDYANKDKSAIDNTWKGFFIAEASVGIPGIFNDESKTTKIGIKDLIYDRGNGLSGKGVLKINQILEAGGWKANMDSLILAVKYNSFEELKLNGKVTIPLIKGAAYQVQEGGKTVDKTSSAEIPFEGTLTLEKSTTASGSGTANSGGNTGGNQSSSSGANSTNSQKRKSKIALNLSLDLKDQTFGLPFLGEKTIVAFKKESTAGLRMVGGEITPFADLTGQISFDLGVEAKFEDATIGFENFRINDTLNPGIAGRGGLDKITFKAFTFAGQTFSGSTGKEEGNAKELLEEDKAGQQKMNGFPLSIQGIKFGKRKGGTDVNDQYALDFSIVLNFVSGIKAFGAKGDFSIYAKPNYAELVKNPAKGIEFKGVGLSGLYIDADLGALAIKGGLKIFKSGQSLGGECTQVKDWGDGFKAFVVLTIKPKLAVSAVAQFGKTSGDNGFRYFFVDAEGVLDAPSPASAYGLSVYGLGGGLYYNMTRVLTPADSIKTIKKFEEKVKKKEFSDPSTVAEKAQKFGDEYLMPGKALTPGCFIPARGKNGGSIVGFKATLIAGLQSPQTLVGDATFGMELDVGDFSLRKVFFDISAYIGNAGVLERRDAAITATASLLLDLNDTKLVGNLKVKIEKKNTKIIEGGGYGHLLFNLPCDPFKNLTSDCFDPSNMFKKDWHVYMGKPSNPFAVNMAFGTEDNEIKFTGTEFYAMMGSELEPMKPLSEIIPGYNITEAKTDRLKDKASTLGGGTGIAFGAKLTLPELSSEFLIFYADFNGGLGFDVALQKLSAAACGGGSAPGIQGWYAKGRAYAYLNADFGVNVKLAFINGKYSFFKLNALAELRAELPNPTWMMAKLNAHGEILGGMIALDVNFKLEIGEKCNVNSNPLADFPIIEEIKPGAVIDLDKPSEVKAEENVSVYESPVTAFNFPVDKIIKITSYDDDGKEEIFNFKPKLKQIELLKIADTKATSGDKVNGNFVLAKDKKSVAFTASNMLDPQSFYRLKVEVAWQECNEEGKNCKDFIPEGEDAAYIERKAAIFKTGNLSWKIDDKAVADWAPGKSQRYWHKNYASPKILFKQEGNDYLFPETSEKLKSTLKDLGKDYEGIPDGVEIGYKIILTKVFSPTSKAVNKAEEVEITKFPGKTQYTVNTLARKNPDKGKNPNLLFFLPFIKQEKVTGKEVTFGQMNEDITLEKGAMYRLEVRRYPKSGFSSYNLGAIAEQTNIQGEDGGNIDLVKEGVKITKRVAKLTKSNQSTNGVEQLFQKMCEYHFAVSQYDNLYEKLEDYSKNIQKVDEGQIEEISDYDHPEANTVFTPVSLNKGFKASAYGITGGKEGIDNYDQQRLIKNLKPYVNTDNKYPWWEKMYEDQNDKAYRVYMHINNYNQWIKVKQDGRESFKDRYRDATTITDDIEITNDDGDGTHKYFDWRSADKDVDDLDGGKDSGKDPNYDVWADFDIRFSHIIELGKRAKGCASVAKKTSWNKIKGSGEFSVFLEKYFKKEYEVAGWTHKIRWNQDEKSLLLDQEKEINKNTLLSIKAPNGKIDGLLGDKNYHFAFEDARQRIMLRQMNIAKAITLYLAYARFYNDKGECGFNWNWWGTFYYFLWDLNHPGQDLQNPDYNHFTNWKFPKNEIWKDMAQTVAASQNALDIAVPWPGSSTTSAKVQETKDLNYVAKYELSAKEGKSDKYFVNFPDGNDRLLKLVAVDPSDYTKIIFYWDKNTNEDHYYTHTDGTIELSLSDLSPPPKFNNTQLDIAQDNFNLIATFSKKGKTIAYIENSEGKTNKEIAEFEEYKASDKIDYPFLIHQSVAANIVRNQYGYKDLHGTTSIDGFFIPLVKDFKGWIIEETVSGKRIGMLDLTHYYFTYKAPSYSFSDGSYDQTGVSRFIPAQLIQGQNYTLYGIKRNREVQEIILNNDNFWKNKKRLILNADNLKTSNKKYTLVNPAERDMVELPGNNDNYYESDYINHDNKVFTIELGNYSNWATYNLVEGPLSIKQDNQQVIVSINSVKFTFDKPLKYTSHILFSSDGKNLTFYLNRKKVSTKPITQSINSGKWTLGKGMGGQIDFFRFYDKATLECDVWTNNLTNPVLDWSFKAPYGTLQFNSEGSDDSNIYLKTSDRYAYWKRDPFERGKGTSGIENYELNCDEGCNGETAYNYKNSDGVVIAYWSPGECPKKLNLHLPEGEQIEKMVIYNKEKELEIKYDKSENEKYYYHSIYENDKPVLKLAINQIPWINEHRVGVFKEFYRDIDILFNHEGNRSIYLKTNKAQYSGDFTIKEGENSKYSLTKSEVELPELTPLLPQSILRVKTPENNNFYKLSFSYNKGKKEIAEVALYDEERINGAKVSFLDKYIGNLSNFTENGFTYTPFQGITSAKSVKTYNWNETLDLSEDGNFKTPNSLHLYIKTKDGILKHNKKSSSNPEDKYDLAFGLLGDDYANSEVPDWRIPNLISKQDQSIAFTGGNSVISFKNSSGGANPFFGANEHPIELWIRPKNPNKTEPQVIYFHEPKEKEGGFLTLLLSGGKLLLQVYRKELPQQVKQLEFPTSLKKDNWYQVFIQLDVDGKECSLIVNGMEVSESFDFTLNKGDLAYYRLGDEDNSFEGEIDNFRTWNKPLSSSDIKKIQQSKESEILIGEQKIVHAFSFDTPHKSFVISPTTFNEDNRIIGELSNAKKVKATRKAIDNDGDGFTFDVDCDDNNAAINPKATEIFGNEIDENCDGIIYEDKDKDGFLSDVDCDDNNAAINPDATEIKGNEIDENCDGFFLTDRDKDGFLSDVDCDDNNAAINPDATDIAGNKIDEDCDGEDKKFEIIGSWESSTDNKYIWRIAEDLTVVTLIGKGNNSELDFSLTKEGETYTFLHNGYKNIINMSSGDLLRVQKKRLRDNKTISDEYYTKTKTQPEPYKTQNLSSGGVWFVEPTDKRTIDRKLKKLEVAGIEQYSKVSRSYDLKKEEDRYYYLDETSRKNYLYVISDGSLINSLEIKPSQNDTRFASRTIYPKLNTEDKDNDGYIANVDCDDNNAAINPGATEILNNNIDEDCNGVALKVEIVGSWENSTNKKEIWRFASDLAIVSIIEKDITDYSLTKEGETYTFLTNGNYKNIINFNSDGRLRVQKKRASDGNIISEKYYSKTQSEPDKIQNLSSDGVWKYLSGYKFVIDQDLKKMDIVSIQNSTVIRSYSLKKDGDRYYYFLTRDTKAYLYIDSDGSLLHYIEYKKTTENDRIAVGTIYPKLNK